MNSEVVEVADLKFYERLLTTDPYYDRKKVLSWTLDIIDRRLGPLHFRYLKTLPNSRNILVCVSDDAVYLLEGCYWIEKTLPLAPQFQLYDIYLTQEGLSIQETYYKRLNYVANEWFLKNDYKGMIYTTYGFQCRATPRFVDFLEKSLGIAKVEKAKIPTLRG